MATSTDSLRRILGLLIPQGVCTITPDFKSPKYIIKDFSNNCELEIEPYDVHMKPDKIMRQVYEYAWLKEVYEDPKTIWG